MSLDKPDLHLRLDERAMLELKTLADARCETVTKVASDLLTRSLMGESYAIRVAAARMIKAGIFGSGGE